MSEINGTRREFLGKIGMAAGTVFVSSTQTPLRGAGPEDLHIACNQYTWQEYYRREGKDFLADASHGLGEVAKAGIDGFEPLGESPEQVGSIGRILAENGLGMRSLYVNSSLHDAEKVEASINQILKIAEEAHAFGTGIIVTNPSPIQWGGPENKTDAQLRTQAEALNTLGKTLSQIEMKLAYHNHDIELREAAREFHHMMVGTDPRLVHLCLDAHWVYRGSGNSQVALFDVIDLYGDRVIELHFRQSQDGIWMETFADGDVDYRRVAAQLQKKGVRPLLVLEQAVEKGTAQTLSPLKAHQRSIQYARQVFREFQG